ncbi:MAG: hypothetical protein ABIU11_05760 [Chitinophagaceae bacterium]
MGKIAIFAYIKRLSVMTKENILAEETGYHADLLAKDFLNDEAVTPQQAFAAMEKYKGLPYKKAINKNEISNLLKWLKANNHLDLPEKGLQLITKQYLQSTHTGV